MAVEQVEAAQHESVGLEISRIKAIEESLSQMYVILDHLLYK